MASNSAKYNYLKAVLKPGANLILCVVGQREEVGIELGRITSSEIKGTYLEGGGTCSFPLDKVYGVNQILWFDDAFEPEDEDVPEWQREI